MRGKQNLSILSIGMTGKKEILKISSDLQRIKCNKGLGAGGGARQGCDDRQRENKQP